MHATTAPALHRLRRAGGWVLTSTAVALAAAVLVPALLGYERYVITGGSMTGSIARGSLLYARLVPTDTLRVGDVITYDPPATSGLSGAITHRIVAIRRDADGRREFRTKGDANRHADPWRFALAKRTQARAAFEIPYIGFALAALSDRRLRMLLIGIPAILVTVSVLAGLWRDASAAVAQERVR